MNRGDTSERSEPESNVEPPRTVARSGREYVSKVTPSLRDSAESGAVTAIIGGASLLSGIRALLGGERKRGLARLGLGAAFLAAALAQRRSRSRGGGTDVEEPDVVDTGPDIVDTGTDDGTVADEAGGVAEADRTADEAAAEVTDASAAVEDVEPETASELDTESASADRREVVDIDTESEDVDRLGEAAFDRRSREVPAPQRAFNRGFLAHSAEAFWGISERDDSVLVSQDYDAVEGRDGVRYVASSEIGDDVRELPIPDAVLDHWDEVGGGGTAVAGGDGILFVTTDDLAADGVLRVLPAEWADDGSE